MKTYRVVQLGCYFFPASKDYIFLVNMKMMTVRTSGGPETSACLREFDPGQGPRSCMGNSKTHMPLLEIWHSQINKSKCFFFKKCNDYLVFELFLFFIGVADKSSQRRSRDIPLPGIGPLEQELVRFGGVLGRSGSP